MPWCRSRWFTATAATSMVWLHMLAVVTYNVLSLREEGRLESIIEEIAGDADIIGLQGTCRRHDVLEGEAYISQQIGDYLVLQWGYGRGAYTNKSAGLVTAFSLKKWKTSEITYIDQPGTELQGRGGFIRLRGRLDVAVLNLYLPPFVRGRGGKVNRAAALKTIEWARGCLNSLPSRCTPIIVTDANSDVGDGKRNYNGTLLEKLMLDFGLALFSPRGREPTYFHHTGSCSRIDFIIAPEALRRAAVGSWPMRRVAKRLQIIPAAEVRDHIPIKTCWKLGGRMHTKSKDENKQIRWSYDKRALRTGEGGADFITELAEEIEKNDTVLKTLREQPDIDKHWEKLVALTQHECDKLDKNLVRYAKKLLGEITMDFEGERPRRLSKVQIEVKMLPTMLELAIRRLQWVQGMSRHPAAHHRIISMIWGTAAFVVAEAKREAQCGRRG